MKWVLLAVLAACRPTVEGGDAGGNGGAEDGGAPGEGDLDLRVHDEVATVLLASWEQPEAAERTWLEVRREDGSSFTTPEKAREAGPAEQAILGLYAEEAVEVRLHAVLDGADEVLASATATTGPLPAGLPEPEPIAWVPELASPEEWVLISVDADGSRWYDGPFYVTIMSRDGRITWYREVPDHRASMFPRPSRTGPTLLYDASTTYTMTGGTPALHRVSLDLAVDETVDMPGFVYGYEELPDGTLLRDRYTGSLGYGLVAQAPDGSVEEIWSCTDWSGQSYYYCYTNTVNWSEERDSVLWSLVERNTVVEIDRATGEVLHYWGEARGAGAIEPEEAAFDFQHFPNFTPDGTLLVSMHGGDETQRAREYRLEGDDLVEVWSYGEGVDEYAYYSGEAARLPNGNTLINYGTGGAAREVTPDGEVAWDVDWGERLLTGHMTLVADLYDLNGE